MLHAWRYIQTYYVVPHEGILHHGLVYYFISLCILLRYSLLVFLCYIHVHFLLKCCTMFLCIALVWNTLCLHWFTSKETCVRAGYCFTCQANKARPKEARLRAYQSLVQTKQGKVKVCSFKGNKA